MTKIGFLGPEGTFSEKAAHKWCSIVPQESYLLVPRESIAQLFHELQTERLKQIIVPVENSIEGAVNVTQDYLIASEAIQILGETNLDIEHYLLTKASKKLSEITAVYSHPQALAQCYGFLQQHLSHAVLYQTSSTAEAAKISANKGEGNAAISSKEAAIKYNLDIIAEKIQDFSGNKTRFWILGKEHFSPSISSFISSTSKISLVVALPYNRPGGLYEILKEFADASIDLTRIESRPSKKELGEYLFMIDFIGHPDDKKITNTLAKLKKKSVMLKILGAYPFLT